MPLPCPRHTDTEKAEEQTNKRINEQTTDDRRTDRGAAPYPAGGANLPRAPESGDASLAALCCHLTLCPRSRIRIFNRKLRTCGQNPRNRGHIQQSQGARLVLLPGPPEQGTS